MMVAKIFSSQLSAIHVAVRIRTTHYPIFRNINIRNEPRLIQQTNRDKPSRIYPRQGRNQAIAVDDHDHLA